VILFGNGLQAGFKYILKCNYADLFLDLAIRGLQYCFCYQKTNWNVVTLKTWPLMHNNII